MIATFRGLAVLAAIAVVLAVALVLSAPAARTVVDRTAVPGFDGAAVTQLVYTRTGQPAITLAKDPSTGWRWTNAERSAADPTTVDATLAALRGAHWHRRGPLAAAGTSRGELAIVVGPRTMHVGIGAPLPGTAQTWITYDGHALLVDTWVADALLPPALALRVRDPGREAPNAFAITNGTVTFEGAHLVAPMSMWVDEARVRALTTALAELQFTSFDRMEPAAPSRTLELRRPPAAPTVLAQAGTCAGGTLTLITSSDGSGCVETAAWQRILDELARYTSPQLADLIDARPLPFAPAKITFADASELVLTGRPHLGADDVDPDRIASLFAALSTPGAVREVLPPGKPRTTLIATDAANHTVTLDVYDDAAVRHGERYAIVPTAENVAVIVQPTALLRDPILWREDATTLSSLVLDRVTYARGAVIGEWTRTPVGTVDAALVEALAETLAIVRGPVATAPTAIDHTLRVTFTPPAGAPTTHTLEIAAATSEGCAARVDGKPVRLGLPLCTAVVALAAAP